MSKLSLDVYIGENQETGKYRIVTSLVKDDFLQVTFTLDAKQAEEWAGKLLEMAQQVRGKNIIVPS